MTREEIKQQVLICYVRWDDNEEDDRSFIELMTDFAMSIKEQAENAAWEAARDTQPVMPGSNIYTYQSPEDWRNSLNK